MTMNMATATGWWASWPTWPPRGKKPRTTHPSKYTESKREAVGR
ncbi:rCG36528 [Rattus norvegicus]|uniref:RCG36528 n=1 Tax=Rattus norvegicus TaxID=10116 RepID=A6JSQ4_RAT|nr:rCG36528 [Rattus norvegicus]